VTTPNGHPDHRWKVAGLSWLAILVLVAVLGFRALGESQRIDDANAAQDVRIQTTFDKVERDIRADCLFKLDVIQLPSLNSSAGIRPNPALIRLAEDARIAFLGKNCPISINPRTGKPFGPPPGVPQ
jgi:hypothetical protein